MYRVSCVQTGPKGGWIRGSSLYSPCINTRMYIKHGVTCMYMYKQTHVRTYVCTNTCVADTGRKRTLFHCKWANSMSYISRMLY